MELSRRVKSATAATIVMVTAVVTDQHVGFAMVRSVTIPPGPAVQTANLHRPTPCVVKVLEVATFRKRALETPVPVLLTDMHPMDKHAATHPVFFAPAENVRAGICNANSY